MPILLGAALGWWIAGAVAAATTVAVGGYYGVSWAISKKHEKGLIEAYKSGGEAGFRLYAYEHLGVKNEDEMNAFFDVHGPKAAVEAMAARQKERSATPPPKNRRAPRTARASANAS